MNKKIIGSIVVVVVVIGASFYGGMSYSKSKATARQGGVPSGQFGTATKGTVGKGMQSGGFTMGQILSKDATGFTIKMQDGSTKIILTSSNIQVMKMTTGTQDDLKVDTNVTVTGSTNSDGSITAQSIQIRPAGSMSSTTPVGR
jgi:uncharacterized protein (UPF0333 family)